MAEQYLGEIRIFAGNFAPEGWHVCDGTLLPVDQYAALFSLIGTTYGDDGTKNFALPDLRGRLPLGSGASERLTPRPLGQAGGAEEVALTHQETWHFHRLQATTATAALSNPKNALYARTAWNTTGLKAYLAALPGTVDGPFNPRVIAPAGGGQPHSNIMPCQGVNYIIALVGDYPM